MTVKLALRIVAWLLLAGLIFVTLAPIDLRPTTPAPVQLERAAALAVIGFIFALAYPRHIWLVTLVVLGSTALLEALQLMSPSRHGRFIDVFAKLAGGGIGILAGWLLWRWRPQR